MATATKTEPITFARFCKLVPDGQKADLIGGVIYMASPDNTDANDLFMWLGGLMYDYVQIKSLGRVFGSRVAFRLDDLNGPEPDIAFVATLHEGQIKRGRVEGGPDLAVEIVSPESVERDYTKKRNLYEKAGVREYWIVDELKKRITLLRLDKKGKYRKVRAKGDVLHSEAMPGFWLNRQWLWQDPLPRKYDVLREILGEG